MPLGWCLQEIYVGSSAESLKRTPSARSLRKAVSDLIVIYGSAEIQQNLQALHGQVGKQAFQAVSHMLLPFQVPVLETLGLSGDLDGVKVLQNAIFRRVNEGDIELRDLANQALKVIGAPTIEASARDMNLEDYVTEMKEGPLYSTDLAQLMSLDEEAKDLLAELHKRCKPRSPLCISLLKVWSVWEQIGLPAECFAHQELDPLVARLHKPTVKEFSGYVMRNQPVVIAGAFDETEFPPLHNFADFSFLRQRCGDRPIRVKGNMCEDRDGRQVYVSDPVVEMPFSEYLDLLEEAEQNKRSPSFYMGKVPLDKELPELVEDIMSSPCSPLGKYGSCFGPNNKGVYTYFGCGRNTTSTHYDPSENLLLVVRGTKTLQLFPPTDADCLYPTKPPTFTSSAIPPFTWPMSMPDDLRERFPCFSRSRPVLVELAAGDLLYLPICWWHGVTGGDEINMILNWWCQLSPQKHSPLRACEGARGLLQRLSKG